MIGQPVSLCIRNIVSSYCGCGIFRDLVVREEEERRRGRLGCGGYAVQRTTYNVQRTTYNVQRTTYRSNIGGVWENDCMLAGCAAGERNSVERSKESWSLGGI
ncbi:unnamed protein product [Ectocarpus fasciculatus]